MNACLRLQGETRTEILGRRQAFKGESEYIGKYIESIFWTGLQQEGAIVKC